MRYFARRIVADFDHDKKQIVAGIQLTKDIRNVGFSADKGIIYRCKFAGNFGEKNPGNVFEMIECCGADFHIGLEISKIRQGRNGLDWKKTTDWLLETAYCDGRILKNQITEVFEEETGG